MENEINVTKKCKNCIHYLQHYIKSRGQFRQIDGHCINRKPSGHFRKTDNPCEHYTAKDLQKEKEEQIKSARELLSFIAERLNDLTQILKDENETIDTL